MDDTALAKLSFVLMLGIVVGMIIAPGHVCQ